MPEYFLPKTIRTRMFSLPYTQGKDIPVCTVEPLQQIKTTPVVFIGGWGTNLHTYQKSMEVLAQRGSTTYAIVPPREGKNRQVSQSNVQGPEIEMNKAHAVTVLFNHLQQERVKEVDIIAHSEGGIIGTLAVLLYAKTEQSPQLRSLTLITPAGLNGKDNALGIAARFISQGIKSALLRPDIYKENKTAKAFARPLTAVHEVMAIAGTHTLPLLRRLHDEYGITINIIAGKHDPVFPTRRIARTIKDTDFINFEELNIRHNGMQSQPQLVMEKAYEMIHAHNL